jgi:hypothetical protein
VLTSTRYTGSSSAGSAISCKGQEKNRQQRWHNIHGSNQTVDTAHCTRDSQRGNDSQRARATTQMRTKWISQRAQTSIQSSAHLAGLNGASSGGDHLPRAAVDRVRVQHNVLLSQSIESDEERHP